MLRQQRASRSPEFSSINTSRAPASRKVHSSSADSLEQRMMTEGACGCVARPVSHCNPAAAFSEICKTTTSAISALLAIVDGNVSDESSLIVRQPRTRTGSLTNCRCSSGPQRDRDSSTTIFRSDSDITNPKRQRGRLLQVALNSKSSEASALADASG